MSLDSATKLAENTALAGAVAVPASCEQEQRMAYTQFCPVEATDVASQPDDDNDDDDDDDDGRASADCTYS